MPYYEDEFKAIPFFRNYEINHKGKVRNCLTRRILTPYINHNGYFSVRIGERKNQKHKCIHILIAKLFIPNPNNYKLVSQIDGNKLNNKINNLQWVLKRKRL